MRRFVLPLSCVVLAIAFLLPLPFASNSMVMQSKSEKLRVVLAGKKTTTADISALVRDGVRFFAIDEFASKLALKLAYDNAREKMEILLPNSRIKLSARNPFIVVADAKGASVQDVFQLQHDVVQTTNSYFVPAAEFIPLFSRMLNREMILDAKKNMLTVTAKQYSSDVKPTAATPAAKQPAHPVSYDLRGLAIDERKNGTLVRIRSAKPIADFESSQTDNHEVLLTLKHTTADAADLMQTPLVGDVKKLTLTQKGSDVAIQMNVAPEVESHDVLRDSQSNDLLLVLYRAASVDSIYSAEQRTKKQTLDRKRAKWSLDAIVIDAGHGGKDPGTIGVAGTKEKNVTLGIALKLGKLIADKMKDVKVIYTRKTDTFIELYRRGQIANEEAGKLFISIHCNATEKKPSSAKGFEVYLLRPGKSDDAVRVAELENSVIKFEKDFEKRYAKLTTENFILINMAQSAFVKYSELFAEQLHLKAKSHSTMKSNGVKQAGFYVLVGASMPSVLIETGFLSNKDEEKYLASAEGQSSMAQMIFESIVKYSKEYERSLGSE